MYMYVHMYMHMYVCMYVYMYIYMLDRNQSVTVLKSL